MKQIRNNIAIFFFLLFPVFCAQAQTDIPDSPVFRSASVTPGVSPGEVTLRWWPSDSADVEGYIIYQVIGNTSFTIDTVHGRLSTQYINTNSQAAVQNETYRIASFDTLLFKSMITNPHTTMLISSEYEQCEQTVSLSWSAYIGFANGVSGYRIYRKTLGDLYEPVALLEGDILAYDDENLEPGATYCYYVEALDDSGNAASSNETCKFLEGFIAPRYLIASSVIVDGNAVNLGFTVDPDAEVSEYKLLRSDQKEGVYRIIGALPHNSQATLNFIDTDVQVNEKVFYYKIASYDPCKRLSGYSNVSCNIVVNVAGNPELSHTVNWTPAEFVSGVDYYNVLALFGESSAFLAGQSDFTELSYSHNIEYYVGLRHARKEYVPNNYCYYIEAFENSGAHSQPSLGFSRSNIACTSHQPVVWMPTAFAPGSFNEKNKFFGPVVSFVDFTSYKMTIFNRFGMEVYSTNETFGAWDGTIKGVRAPADTYIYRIEYSNGAGNDFEQTGFFNLLY